VAALLAADNSADLVLDLGHIFEELHRICDARYVALAFCRDNLHAHLRHSNASGYDHRLREIEPHF
jgi:hypothetical protein